MSIFSYKLDRPEDILSLEDLAILIASYSYIIPRNMFACVEYEGKPSAYRLCCQDDIRALNALCRNKPISILFTPQVPENPLPFKGFQQTPLKSCDKADFIILDIRGISDGTDVSIGTEINKLWRLKVSGNAQNLIIKCTEGDYYGAQGTIKVQDQILTASVSLKAPMKTGWCSSIWRVLNNSSAFGPLLWIEFNIM